ncbi:MAG: hypothetical protein ACKOXB_04125 [Flavobacteriales bacterium]
MKTSTLTLLLLFFVFGAAQANQKNRFSKLTLVLSNTNFLDNPEASISYLLDGRDGTQMSADDFLVGPFTWKNFNISTSTACRISKKKLKIDVYRAVVLREKIFVKIQHKEFSFLSDSIEIPLPYLASLSLHYDLPKTVSNGSGIPFSLFTKLSNDATVAVLPNNETWLKRSDFTVKYDNQSISGNSLPFHLTDFQSDSILLSVSLNANPSISDSVYVKYHDISTFAFYFNGRNGNDGHSGYSGNSGTSTNPNGTSGTNGEDGKNGENAPEINVYFEAKTINKQDLLFVKISSSGETHTFYIHPETQKIEINANGGNGGRGGYGGNGFDDRDKKVSSYGGNGGHGGSGGYGGNGSVVTFHCDSTALRFQNVFIINNKGGNGGEAGNGGSKGYGYQISPTILSTLFNLNNGYSGDSGRKGYEGYPGNVSNMIEEKKEIEYHVEK